MPRHTHARVGAQRSRVRAHAKTEHLLPHKLARYACHGKRGTIHQAYSDGVEDQPGALGLTLNAIALWATKYLDAVGTLRCNRCAMRTPPGLGEDDEAEAE